MTRPDMSIKVERQLHDMRILGRIVGVRSTEQFVRHLLPTTFIYKIQQQRPDLAAVFLSGNNKRDLPGKTSLSKEKETIKKKLSKLPFVSASRAAHGSAFSFITAAAK